MMSSQLGSHQRVAEHRLIRRDTPEECPGEIARMGDNLTDIASYDQLKRQQLSESDDFYEKIKMLKEEHTKLLGKCEEEFKKTKECVLNTTGMFTPTDSSTPTRSYSSNHNGSVSSENNREVVDATRFEQFVKDYVKDMSSSKKCLKFETTCAKSECDMKPLKFANVGLEGSVDRMSPESLMMPESNGSEMEHYKENHDIIDHNDTRRCALARIEDMWDKFSVNDYYVPCSRVEEGRPRLERSQSLTAKDKQEKAAMNWRKKITIPEPFSMLIREENKTPKKTKAMIELELEREKKKRFEELECQKKFKASPAPQHIYQNLFDKIQEQQDARRRCIQTSSAELLKALQKPFQFLKREEGKKKERFNQSMVDAGEKNKKQNLFKAHPFPARIFNRAVSDKIEEEEAYRQIRMRIRAEELMKSSSLPPSMKAKGLAYTEGKLRQKLFEERAQMAGLTAEHYFRPKVNNTVPDFEVCHRHLDEELAERKRQKEATIAMPFNLRSSRHSLKKHKIYEDVEKDAKVLKENNWSFNRNPNTNPLSKSFSVSDSLNSTLTEQSNQQLTVQND